jgi:hypothetical protein
MGKEQRGRLIAVVLLAGASSVLQAGCGAPAVPAGSVSSASSAARATGAGTASPAARAAAPPGPVTANLPVVSCPTSSGVALPAPAVPLPRSRRVAVPQAMAARLSVYTDSQGRMELVGPKGWNCAAFYGADGSGGVAVYHPGQALPKWWTAGWPLARTSAAAVVTGLESSACYTCTLGQACRLFPVAAATLDSYLGRQACRARPAAEMVTAIGPGIAGFEDPPGTSGDGVPSGGRYPANGVMTYHPHAAAGSWQETCTLPGSDMAECTAILNTFLSWYGQQ